MSIILASQSPRRRELLQQMGITEFKVIPAKGEEVIDPSLSPEKLVESLALQKASEVAAQCDPKDVVIGADTIVVLDGKVLGKPANTASAFKMLCSLSTRRHTVYTGVAVIQGEKIRVSHEATQVRFCDLSETEILDYIATGEPMDKAGAYGIQGDYFNVVGLPICRLGRMLAGFGIRCL